MKYKSKKAFTLIEMVVVVALVAIVGVAVISIMTPAGNMFAKMQSQAQTKMIASGILQAIEPQVRFGTDLSVLSSQSQIVSGDDNRYIYIKNNRVYTRKENQSNSSEYDLFGVAFYNNYNISMDCSVPAPNTVQISITASNSDRSVTSMVTTTVQNMNSSSVSGNGSVLRYEWRTAPPSQSS